MKSQRRVEQIDEFKELLGWVVGLGWVGLLCCAVLGTTKVAKLSSTNSVLVFKNVVENFANCASFVLAHSGSWRTSPLILINPFI